MTDRDREAQQEARLHAWLNKKQQPCLGCGAKAPYETEEPYAGHAVPCSLVTFWRKPLR